MISALLSFIALLCLVHILFNYNKSARLIKRIPGPRDLFIVGNAIDINVSPVELFKLGRKYANKWKGIFRIWAYPFGFVHLCSPEDIEVIISTPKHNEKSIIYKFLKPWLRDGLLLSNGSKWLQRRKILTPSFHFNILRQFCMVFEENNGRMVKKLNTALGEPVDLAAIISELTLNSICETAMGTQLNTESSQHGKSYKEAIYRLGSFLVKRFVKIYLYFDFTFNISSLGRSQKQHLTVVHRFTEKVIRDRKQDLHEQTPNNDEDDNSEIYMHSKKKRAAMLDVLITAQKEGLINDEGIQEEVDTFMFEGHDTTAAGLTFCLMLLANNRHVQDKIVDELKDTLGDLDKPVTIEELSKLRYLECCIKESLRLYPPVYFISRKIAETVQLSNYTVPAGTVCCISIYDLHRREDLFKNALEFDPDRFLPENCIGRHPYAYIPFSAGPRNCIGQKFAMYEMKSVVAAILRNYIVLPVTSPADIEIVSDLVMRNNGPVYAKFVRREHF